MKSYIIIYRASNAMANTMVVKKIKTFPCWAFVLGNHWFVKSDYSANQIYEMINPLVGLSGRVIVVAVKRNAAWYDISNSDFIQKHL